MNTNDELRAMLDERGVNWDYDITGAATTKFSANGVDLTFMPMRDGLICTTILTPAQAIAATLGSGTVEKAVERIEVLSGFAREYLHRYGMLMSMAGEDVTDEVLAVESVINEVCGRKVVDR